MLKRHPVKIISVTNKLHRINFCSRKGLFFFVRLRRRTRKFPISKMWTFIHSKSFTSKFTRPKILHYALRICKCNMYITNTLCILSYAQSIHKLWCVKHTKILVMDFLADSKKNSKKLTVRDFIFGLTMHLK